MTTISQESGTLPVVLLLATGHLANNNLDMFNVQFDDMLSPTAGNCAMRGAVATLPTY